MKTMRKIMLALSLLVSFYTQALDITQMNVILLGDSNTWIGGDACDKSRGWNYWWVKSCSPASCRSFARSGATWTNTSATVKNLVENISVLGNDNVIYNQVMRLIDSVDNGSCPEPDLIVVAAGTNDAWFHKKRPGLFDAGSLVAGDGTDLSRISPSEVTSLAASVELSCALLADRFPGALVILLTPHQTTATAPENIARVSEIIVQCGARLSLPVIRQDLYSGIVSESERKSHVNTTDGTHTSIAGAQVVARFLEKEIKSILKDRQ
jgi:lysophospholipase L1-like esterase